MVDQDQNLILIFGCAANYGVPALSKIANTFFEVLEESTAENGCILLPDQNFIHWTPNATESQTGEKVIKTTLDLHFYGSKPESNESRGAVQVFDYSRMEGQYFEPDDKLCLIFDNTKYERLLELPEYNIRDESQE